MKETNKNKRSFEESPLKQGYTEGHKEHLGMNVPEGFFADSKKAILVSVSEIDEQRSIKRISPRTRYFKIAVAASVTIIFASTLLFLIYKTTLFNQNSLAEDTLRIENDIAFNTLFPEEGNLDEYIDNYLFEDILFEAEYEENNVIINSLLLEDNEADAYIDEYLIENLIL